ncbi:MAG: pyridoxine kinase, partial [Ruminococcus sp.]|nr:pyridoxine kinase [Ruminococcus sp.]
VFTKQDCSFVKAECHGGSFSGTGDIFASIVFASVVNGESLVSAVRKAVSFIEKATADTAKEPYDRNDGINFEKFLYQLHNQLHN